MHLSLFDKGESLKLFHFALFLICVTIFTDFSQYVFFTSRKSV